MTTASKDLTALKLYADRSGQMWYVDRDGPVVASGRDQRAFMQLPVYQGAKHIRLLGSAANAKLILQLIVRKKNKDVRKLELCSPMIAGAAEEPEIALINMRRCTMPSSVGGFHDVGNDDYYNYLLIYQLQKQKGVVDDQIKRIIAYHPAWPSLSFISNIDAGKAAVLLATLVDPRWFIDQNEPNSGSKLKAYLGLNPKTQAHVSDGSEIIKKDIDARWAERCKLVLDTWKTTSNPPSDAFIPSHFLWRFWIDKGDAGVASDLRTSQYFVSYLRHTWIAALYGGKSAGEELFVPEYFFKEKMDADSYRHHLGIYKRPA